MTRIIDWEDFQKENSLYLENQGMKKPTVSEAFRLGQLAFISQIAETLGCSLTYNSLDWIDEIGAKLRRERNEKDFDSNEFVYSKGYEKLINSPKADFFESEDGRRIAI